jgi:hypothetical protein
MLFHYGDCEKKIKKYEHLLHIKDEQIVDLELQKAQLIYEIASLKQREEQQSTVLDKTDSPVIDRSKKKK